MKRSFNCFLLDDSLTIKKVGMKNLRKQLEHLRLEIMKSEFLEGKVFLGRISIIIQAKGKTWINGFAPWKPLTYLISVF